MPGKRFTATVPHRHGASHRPRTGQSANALDVRSQGAQGRITIHSSPCVAGGQVYVGAMHQVLGLAQGFLYCVNAQNGRQSGDQPIAPGGRIWTFSGSNSLLPVFSSPTVVDGRVYIGEGYHQNSGCRLFCLDAQTPTACCGARPRPATSNRRPRWMAAAFTSAPATTACAAWTLPRCRAARDGDVPKTVWHLTGVHVDSSPTLLDGRLFAGSVLGDVHQESCALGIDADTGETVWKIPAPVPLAGAPAAADGRVFFTLGNGKLNEDADAPDGRVWCLERRRRQARVGIPLGQQHSRFARGERRPGLLRIA